jgi:hypothetical protein
MAMISKLPVAIFDIVKDYFLSFTIDKDENEENIMNWRDFCNCSKQFHEIKRYFCYYNLNSINSTDFIKYKTDKFYLQRSTEMEKIANIISNLNKQLSLQASNTHPFTIEDFRDRIPCHTFLFVKSSFSIASILTGMSSLYCVDLSNQANLHDVTPLKDVKIIILKYSDVINVNCLGNCRELDISYTEVVDVSGLGRVHRLSVVSCPVKDVSALGFVYELDISYCTGITDASMLGNVKRLTMSGSHFEQYSSILARKDQYLHVWSVDSFTLPLDNTINAMSFLTKDAQKVCDSINKDKLLFIDGNEQDLQNYSEFAFLHFRWNTVLTQVFHLEKVQKLTIYYCDLIKSIGEMPLLTDLTLDDINPRGDFPADGKNLIDYQSLPKLRRLMFKKVGLMEVRFAGSVEKVRLDNCFKLNSVYLECHLKLLRIRKSPIAVTVHRSDNNFGIDCLYSAHTCNFVN